jgi:hypothetical protein
MAPPNLRRRQRWPAPVWSGMTPASHLRQAHTRAEQSHLLACLAHRLCCAPPATERINAISVPSVSSSCSSSSSSRLTDSIVPSERWLAAARAASGCGPRSNNPGDPLAAAADTAVRTSRQAVQIVQIVLWSCRVGCARISGDAPFKKDSKSSSESSPSRRTRFAAAAAALSTDIRVDAQPTAARRWICNFHNP